MVVEQKLYTAEEFWQMVEEGQFEDKWCELVEGVIVESFPSNLYYSAIAAMIATHIFTFVKEHALGYTFPAGLGYTLTPHDVRVPRASFMSYSRLPELPKVINGAPDLAVEVILPSESPRKVNDKTALYLNTGAKLVWNVYPEEKVVEVWQKGAGDKLEMQPFGIEDTLDGGDVLPGFQLPVKQIFPD